MQGIAAPGGAIGRRRSHRRTRVVAAALAAAALAAGLSVATPALAVPAAPSAPAQAVDPAAGAIAARPAEATTARQILERLGEGLEPTAGEVDTLARLLARPQAERLAAVRQVATSPRYLPVLLDGLFRQHLDRPADPGGIASWSTRVRNGATLETVLVSLELSNEAWVAAGANNADYVTHIYLSMLDRGPDPAGRAYWIAKLNGGTSRDRFIRSFLRTRERAGHVVDRGFEQYLDRPADPGGRASWVTKYTSAVAGQLDLLVSLLASVELRQSGCGYDASHCLLPFPSNRYTVREPNTVTGWRVAFKPDWMPRNKNGKPIDPVEWNRNDGFSVGQAALTRVPGIDLAQTGVAGLDDIGASLDADAPIVVLDATTGERHPYFAELDANTTVAADRTLSIRPAVNYEPDHTYVVALRDLKTASGSAIAPNARFAAHLARLEAAESAAGLEAWEVDLQFGLAALADEGVTLDATLHQAWTFTVASVENTTGRSLHIRDQALATLGSGAPAFTVGTVTPNPRVGVAKRIEGTFQVPLYLTGTGAPGAGFKTGSNGLPVRNGSYTANYDCEIPTTASTTPARATVYGHGLFGGLGEVRSGPQAAMVTGHNMAYCATDWIGMADPDILNAAVILSDLSTFHTLPDRSQQGILNTIFLGRLLHDDAGFVSNAAFKTAGGEPLIDTSALFYDGNSQGAVIGGAYLALSPDTSAGVLGVAGMNYATLLERSVDFDPFNDLLKGTYPDPVDRVVGLQVLQMLWDRGETNGYAAHLASDRLPGSSPSARVLIHTALGDHQVATLTAEIEARTAGIPVHRPYLAAGRTGEASNAWGLADLSYPSTGSALVIWDSGAALSPSTNVPPRTGRDPHGDPRWSPQSQQQKSAFLATGGTITDVCSGAPCTAPAS